MEDKLKINILEIISSKSYIVGYNCEEGEWDEKYEGCPSKIVYFSLLLLFLLY